MKFLASSMVLAAVMATTTLVAASEQPMNAIHAPVLRRDNHHQKRKSCSAGSSKKHHKKTHGKKKSHKSSSSSSSGSSDSSSKKSSDNDQTDSSSGSSKSTGGVSGSGNKLKLKSKQGLAWPNSNGMNIKNFITGGVSFAYSWTDTPGWDGFPIDELVFCPMLWGNKNADSFMKNVVNDQNGKFNKYKCAMGMNEVNQKGQSDMSVGDACKLMRSHIMPLADKGWYIIGPSTTSAPNGLTQWYKQFQSECGDVFDRMDAISLHWYDVSIDAFKKYVENWHNTFKKPVWITEFACQNFNGGAQCSKSETDQMMKEMSDWFMQQDYVVGFSPFGVMQNLQGVSEVNRLSQGSNPTSLFRMFADA